MIATDKPPVIDKRLPRYMALRDHIFAKIADGGWSFDDVLPSESALAAKYGVALGTMRRAIEELVREGVLERRHGSGTYVRRADFSGSLFHFLRFRSTHSTISAQESRIFALRVEPAPSYVRQALNLKAGDEAIFMDRRRYHDGELLAAEENWLLLDKFSALLEIPMEDVGPLVYRTYEVRCNQYIAYARESLKIISAEPDIAKLMGIEIGGPAAVIERTAYDFSDHPLEWRRSHAKTEHFEYRIDIR